MANSAAVILGVLLVTLALIALTVKARVWSTQGTASSERCRPDGPIVELAGLPEASGVATSQRAPGRLWTHNDSAEPMLFALDLRGSIVGRLRLSGATVVDWEAIAVGPCPSGSCIHVADIGDNNATRRDVVIYRVSEPATADDTAAVEILRAAYPDGPHDAEALLMFPDGGLYIVTKGNTGPVTIYRFPGQARPGGSVRLERVGGPRPPTAQARDRVTDGAVSPDGQRVVLRTNESLLFYDAAQFRRGNWQDEQRVDLRQLREPQGEGVTFGADRSLYLVGESGGGKQAGTFAHLVCTE